ncbi:ribosome maturation factor RimM [Amaricoccus tamworthensis]|uniref:ribosome maturation factor RimM n=1 Tax=Amaricoccus tamworthensis TaxID=57002 RepID=UPI003C7DA750
MPADKSLVCLGAIAGAWGVRGDVRLKSFCADPASIAEYAPLTSEDGRSFDIRIVKAIKGAFAARLSGVTTREEAEELKGTRLYAPRARLPEPEEDEFYHADLIGLTAIDTGGTEIGRVGAVMDHGAGDILEIRIPGQNALLIPFTLATVPTVDIAGGRIVIDPPAEILGDRDD